MAFHVVALAMLVFVAIPPLTRTSAPETIFRGLAEVTGYTLRTPMLLGTLYVIVLMNALGFPVEQFVPAIGKDELGVGPMLVGLLVSALAMGQITAAAAMAFMRIERNHGRLLMLGFLVVLVMGLMLAWSPVYALSFAVFSVSGCGQACFATMQGTMTLLWAPPHMRGRMMGLRSLCIGMGGPHGGPPDRRPGHHSGHPLGHLHLGVGRDVAASTSPAADTSGLPRSRPADGGGTGYRRGDTGGAWRGLTESVIPASGLFDSHQERPYHHSISVILSMNEAPGDI